MRKTVRLLFICILTISLLLMPGFAQTGGNGGAVGGKTQKAIAIVLDEYAYFHLHGSGWMGPKRIRLYHPVGGGRLFRARTGGNDG